MGANREEEVVVFAVVAVGESGEDRGEKRGLVDVTGEEGEVGEGRSKKEDGVL